MIDGCEPFEIDREALIAHCEKCFVPQNEWRDRDSYSAQKGVGQLYALLKAGCQFKVGIKDHTLWIDTFARGFNWFEGYQEECDEEEHFLEEEMFYLPTEARLKAHAGGDWY